MNHAIRVFVTDDHSIVRKGIYAILELIPDIEVVGEASNGQEAIKGVEQSAPDVVLMDLVMPEMDGIEAIRHIKAHLRGGGQGFPCYQGWCIRLPAQRFRLA